MCGTRLHIYPVLLFCWFIITFIVLYAWAVAVDDVTPFWPYISDTGSLAPESCVFGQFLSIGYILLAMTLYIRFVQIKYLQKIADNTVIRNNKNNACLILGFISVVGLSIVANFQESNVFFVHITGAVMSFGAGSFYQLIMWKLSKQYLKQDASLRRLNAFRLLLAFISIICFWNCFLFSGVAFFQFNGDNIFKWKKEDGGYEFHLVSTISEWICAVSTMTYLLTFYKDFQTIKMYEPVLELKE